MYGWRIRQVAKDTSEAWLPMLNHPYFLFNRRFTPALDSAMADKSKYETFISSFNNFFWGMKWQCAKQRRGTVGIFFFQLNVSLLA